MKLTERHLRRIIKEEIKKTTIGKESPYFDVSGAKSVFDEQTGDDVEEYEFEVTADGQLAAVSTTGTIMKPDYVWNDTRDVWSGKLT